MVSTRRWWVGGAVGGGAAGGPPTAPSVLSIMVDSDADEWDLLGYGVREVDGVTHRPKNYG